MGTHVANPREPMVLGLFRWSAVELNGYTGSGDWHAGIFDNSPTARWRFR